MEIGAMLVGLKAMATFAKQANRAEVMQQVIELQAGILELQAEHSRLIEQNHALHRAAEDKEAAERQRRELLFESNVYWRGEGKEREGPFCPTCLDQHGKVARLTRYGREMKASCFTCQTTWRLDSV